MSEISTIARPYAKAAFDFALENDQLDKWQEMLLFLKLVVQEEQVSSYLQSVSSPQQIADTIVGICEEQLDQHGQNFIRIMAENRRLTALPSVLKAFIKLRSEYESIKDVEVISATQLSKANETKIATAMEKRLNSKVRIVSKVDQSLIAGIIIRYDDIVIDGSSLGQLNRLANELRL
ncbi:F0F1 ATP synthase subunit delta [Pasteurella skyensis]|uniref:ATP synthase subunit delta n=1 Tax=Phocoenobacter skyensis TaxID=97481 RepID=A0AAJ6P0L1_9PAST|nr:F0F1 ATP synthase subunit delta [Pasteurella skyensis]MDP8162643.1 F0F1 ATP synthase subunit delta [Pasteurella skyensis]MDP8172759.1 F0F1 ATP synthase subunit delta [Pasteurella skyensis]MDP8179324.1 F0F1 ATP synthase subunit delta [Pasteurella skyensis]MDP8183429.1 F0F1 ATP synthase subunit delta [Pasteurella skyensis]MDP8189376.1 F0F1 ATP synthase subunit delta [Pasteurella skyensis]